MNKLLLEYDFIMLFKNIFYKDVLTHEHLMPQQVSINKVTYENGESSDNFNFFGYMLKKDDKKYLLSFRKNKKEISLKECMPLVVTKSIRVSYRGEVYYHIQNFDTVKLRPKRHMSFKELIDIFCSLNHQNKEHQRLWWIVSFANMFSRVNIRLSTPAGFGKDSTVDIWRDLYGGSGTIENPSIAKLEDRANLLKWLAVNEVRRSEAQQWNDMQSFLLSVGAFKSSVTKRTKAHGKVGEEIDISELSLTLMYNDIDFYTSFEKYTDFALDKPVLDRFFPIRLHGRFSEMFEGQSTIDGETFVKSSINDYRKIFETIEYYKEQHINEKHYYKVPKTNFSNRFEKIFLRILDWIDLDSDTQQEFDTKVATLLYAMQDYKEMINYPEVWKHYMDVLGIPEDNMDRFIHLPHLVMYYESELKKREDASMRHKIQHVQKVVEAETFINKHKLMREYRGYSQPAMEQRMLEEVENEIL